MNRPSVSHIHVNSGEFTHLLINPVENQFKWKLSSSQVLLICSKFRTLKTIVGSKFSKQENCWWIAVAKTGIVDGSKSIIMQTIEDRSSDTWKLLVDLDSETWKSLVGRSFWTWKSLVDLRVPDSALLASHWSFLIASRSFGNVASLDGTSPEKVEKLSCDWI